MVKGNSLLLSTFTISELSEILRSIVREELDARQQNDLLEKLLTRAETASLLKVTLVTLYNWEKTDRIRPHRIGGRVFYKYSEIMASLTFFKKYARVDLSNSKKLLAK